MRRECLRAAAVNVVSSQTSPEEGTPDQRQLLTSATPIHERHESLSGGSAVVMEGKECRSLSAKARFHVRQQATPSIVRDKAVFISSQLCARAPHSHHTPFPSRTSTSSKQSDKLARHQRFGVQPPWMATPPAAKASGLSESPVHDSLPGFDDSVNDGSQNENDKKRNSNVSYAQIRRDNATGSNGGPFNVPHSTSNESSSMHTALFAPNTLQRTVSTASKASKTSRASKSSISSASNKRPGNKDRPTSVVPPYWQQMRHNSRASIASFAGQGITLEDNSDRYEDYNDETASGPKSPLWARQIDIAEFVKIEGDIKGVGGYVVWLVRVETLDVNIPYTHCCLIYNAGRGVDGGIEGRPMGRHALTTTISGRQDDDTKTIFPIRSSTRATGGDIPKCWVVAARSPNKERIL